MATVSGQLAEVSFTISVKRKDTGLVETYDMVGYVNPEVLKQLNSDKESDNGNNS